METVNAESQNVLGETGDLQETTEENNDIIILNNGQSLKDMASLYAEYVNSSKLWK